MTDQVGCGDRLVHRQGSCGPHALLQTILLAGRPSRRAAPGALPNGAEELAGAACVIPVGNEKMFGQAVVCVTIEETRNWATVS